MDFLRVLFHLWVVGLCIGTFIPLLREQTYWLRAWTYARLQMLVLVTVTVLFLVFGFGILGITDKLALAALIICVLICLWDIYPFTSFARKHVPSMKEGQRHIPIRMLIANVLMENDNYGALLDKVERHDPDLVFLVETNQAWATQLSQLEDTYKHTYLLPLEDFNGMLLYSKFPILNVDERYLVQDHIPSLTIDFDIGHLQPLRFYGLHPRPPRPEDKTKNLDSELLFIANEAGHQTMPVIVTGDLNDVGWSSTTRRFLRVSGLLDPRRGRGLYNSYNAKNPLVRWPLDHLFHTEHFGLKHMERLEASGSDHFPLLIELGLFQ